MSNICIMFDYSFRLTILKWLFWPLEQRCAACIKSFEFAEICKILIYLLFHFGRWINFFLIFPRELQQCSHTSSLSLDITCTSQRNAGIQSTDSTLTISSRKFWILGCCVYRWSCCFLPVNIASNSISRSSESSWRLIGSQRLSKPSRIFALPFL